MLVNVHRKLLTLGWFAARPAMYGELMRRVLRAGTRTSASLAHERQARAESALWCREAAVPALEVLHAIGVETPHEVLSDSRSDLWEQACKALVSCHGSMGGPGHVDLLYTIVKRRRPQRVVETGVAAGWSSLAILAALDENGRGDLVSVDMPYPARSNEHLVGCVVPANLRSRWVLVRRPDRSALPAITKRGAIGLAHYDSDKSYEGRMFAYPLLWKALEPKGMLVSDDIEDNWAFRDFAMQVGRRPVVIEKQSGNYAGLIVR
jgi:hypothetical protein